MQHDYPTAQGRPVRAKPHRLPEESYLGEVAVAATMCVEGGFALFRGTEPVEVFTAILGGAAEHWNCLIPTYCFMPDHLHLVACGANPKANLWKFLVEFKQKSGFWLGKNVPGVRWQRNFYDHILHPGGDLVAQVRYVLDNPCRRGLVEDWRDYPFSGAIGCRLDDVLAGLPFSRAG